jgi:enediyne polyketide synthase
VGRSLVAEAPDVPVLVLDVPPDVAGIAAAAVEAHRPLRPYAEVVVDEAGVSCEPVVRSLDISPRHDAAIPLRLGEVCLVTGGARGIGLECAAGLGAATGARMVIVGRSDPGSDGVRAALRHLSAAGVSAEYCRADVADRRAAAAVLTDLVARHGPVRGLLHAAGRNEPALIPDLTAAALRATLAPKAGGFDNVLAGLDHTRLRFAVTFGSVIGRTGLLGEADYAVANEWLARRCAQLCAAEPDVRWLNIEWSAWSGTGMGVRLGALEALIRRGLTPVPVREGVDLLLRLLATPGLPPSVLVAGRLPASAGPGWQQDSGEIAGRYLTSRLAYTPGVELVAAADLSVGDDPALADHRLDGTVVVPAAMGLEAMAQACEALGGKPARTGFTGVTFARPITVPDREHRTVRIAALADEDGTIDVVARSEETGFAADHFRGTCPADSRPDLPPAPAPAPAQELMSAQALYGPVHFHGPAFQRVRAYHRISAYRCAGVVEADPGAGWFGAFHDQRLVLGDPGARDAFLHILQACFPDRRLLPVGVADLRLHQRPEGPLTVSAHQRGEQDGELIFDLVAGDAGERLVEEWRGLRLRPVGPLAAERLPIEVCGAHLTRTLGREHPEYGLDLAVGRASRTDGRRTERLATWLTGHPVSHAPDGSLVVAGPGAASASHLDGYVLVAAAPERTAVDWELVTAAEVPLDAADSALAAHLRRDGHDAAAHRIWTCREVLRKLGVPPTASLITGEGPAGGWLTLAADGRSLHSVVLTTTAGTVAACVGAG